MSDYSKLLLAGLCIAVVFMACGTDNKITSDPSDNWSDIPEAPVPNTEMTVVGSYQIEGAAIGVFVKDNFCYVIDANNGLVILDVTTPEVPEKLGQYTIGNAHRVSVFDHYAYLSETGQGVPIIDVGEPTMPELVNIYYSSVVGDGFVSNDILFLPCANGVRSINVVDHRDPVELGIISTHESGKDLTVWGDKAYVAHGMSGMSIVDISNPMNMSLASTIDLPGYATEVCMNFYGDRAYVATGSDGVQIVNVADPFQPILEGTIAPNSSVYGLAMERDFLFMAADNGGVVVYYVGKSTSPQFANSFSDNSRTRGIFVRDGYVFAADVNKGLIVLKFKS